MLLLSFGNSFYTQHWNMVCWKKMFLSREMVSEKHRQWWLTRIICISIREVDFGDNDLGEILYEEQGDCCIINDGASSLTIPDLVKRLCISSGTILTGPAQFYTVLSLGSAGVLHIIGYSGDGSKWHRDMNMIYRPLPFCCWACLLHHSTQMNYW